jgi:peroxiredoxin
MHFWLIFFQLNPFLIDSNGLIAKQYLSVDSSRHSQEIIEDLKN